MDCTRPLPGTGPCRVRIEVASGLTRATAHADDGRGVGMAAVDEEVRKLGGVVAVESERGKGTTWRFTFPLPAVISARSQRPTPRAVTALSA